MKEPDGVRIGEYRMDRRVNELSDDELAERTRTGDRDAYAELWDRHARAGLTAARQFRSIADPDDIVSEAYLQILRALQRGGGPRQGFRPYLYRTVRNLALSWNRKGGPDPVELPEEMEADGPSLEDSVLEKTITVRAFRTLPERWQTVLWYTEVEGMEPTEAARLMGLTPNSAAALAHRARDGFKKAWLQAHVNDERVPAECRWTTARMAEYNRGSLSPRARKRFDEHLVTCTRCSILVDEVDEIGGRLSIILLPLMLGGAAATGLLSDAQPASAAPSSSGRFNRPAGHGRTVIAVGAIGAAVSVAAFALSSVLGAGTGTPAADGSSSQPPATADTPNEPAADGGAPPAAGTKASETTPVPDSAVEPPFTPPSPGDSPSQPLEPEPPLIVQLPPAVPSPIDPGTDPETPPVDAEAPLGPVVSSPADGTLTNDGRPDVSGSGEPGARVTMERDGTIIASTVVGPDGTWTLRPTVAVPDGTQTFVFQQIDAAGNPSPTVTITMVIDTIALPPSVVGIAEPLYFLPVLQGVGEPHSAIVVSDETGFVIGSADAAGDGSWSVPVPDPSRDGAVLTAVQTDTAGNVSAASTPTAPLHFERPTFVSPAQGATIGSTNGSTPVTVEVSGVVGMTVEFLIDGVATGNRHTLTPGSISRLTPPLTDGAHTVSVRYLDPATGAVGSVMTLAFTIVG